MARFFFHTHDGCASLDAEGIECTDVNAARIEAIRTCGEMVREVPAILRGARGEAWRLWVTDQPDGLGTTLLILTVTAQEE